MASEIGESELRTDEPITSGIEIGERDWGRQINLVAETSTVPRRRLVGVERHGG